MMPTIVISKPEAHQSSLAPVARREDCRAVALAKAGRSFWPIVAASYDSACQIHKMGNFTYVYVLQSETDLSRFYMGCTDDLRARLIRHNRGEVPHTSKWKPWRIKTYIALSDRERARSFEKYLKSASGRAFVKKHL